MQQQSVKKNNKSIDKDIIHETESNLINIFILELRIPHSFKNTHSKFILFSTQIGFPVFQIGFQFSNVINKDL